MTEQPSGKLREVELVAAVPTAASPLTDGGGYLYVGVPLAGIHEDGTRHAHPPQVAQAVEVEGSNRSRRRRFVNFAGVLFILTALTQVILAGIIRAQGIKIMDRIWVGTLDNLYPTAGNPYIGILALFIAILFLYIIGLDNNINDGCCSVGCECWIPFVLVIFAFLFGWSFCERAVYRGLNQFDKCVDKTEDLNGSDWTGDCYCWSYGDDSTTANVNIADRMSCDRVLDYTNSVLVSYVLMTILLSLMVVVPVIYCYLSRSATPSTTGIAGTATGYAIPHASGAGEASPPTHV